VKLIERLFHYSRAGLRVVGDLYQIFGSNHLKRKNVFVWTDLLIRSQQRYYRTSYIDEMKV